MKCEKGRARPIHLNRGRHGHVWICLACGKQLGGPSMDLTPAEQRDLVEIIKVLSMSETKPPARAETKERESKMESTQLVFTFEGSPSPAAIAAKLRFQAGLLEGMPGKEAASRKNTDAPQVVNGVDHAEVATMAKEKKKPAAKKAAPPVEEENFDLGEGEMTDDDLGLGEDDAADEAPSVTIDEVRAAFKAYATSKDPKKGRENAAKLLAKHFKIKSINDLKAEDYAKALELVGG